MITPAGNCIYLASRSARRRDLLKQIGIRHNILLMREALSRPADVDETPLPEESPADYVYRITHTKSEAGWLRLKQRGLPLLPVLAADTTVVLDGRILGKPQDIGHAEEMLHALSGQEHQVYTAVGLTFQGQTRLRLSTTTVRFRDISPREIQAYIASGEPHDKAGAYAIQGKAAAFIINIDGSYSGVVGLPLFETSQLLEETGISVF
ncbi:MULTISPECIES: Maf family protein [Nitrosomonas]|uniref:dTTP/UTP pyrophosphatase n=1 Tax=Nitrosomonas europaea (strain ATCC 19718 / CIP 103999 / KCTC 2705 / NBRC 14298) TaxID=228410 RepID=NTPPA_NITEU|nr:MULTISPECIES: nucleoside triphosphate pyrophosphatase [Nitrosomonas]Q82XC7.1 RecName: Full=dTTP/UTP pyrophosphatase; Short=dTTPase/UTPase; AltName: Full=Nucleoside triphosphate pyrophosphatase; AltName: Full=Nucleotide pyrophosphatase; Short=Nucleotide PPase [Nitrosomonas europaea ATCC 19718]CAD84267.1 Maf-like protein [Nitrosomonas europaea ATCC 19718]SDW34877.1 septum formation protein [Nitrosomonas europaea]SES93390.1 septum formation protein [Nitrosomonas europaea]SJZ44835.1 septum form